MLPVPKIQVQIDLDHSCNWRCCWGCKHADNIDAQQFEQMKKELDKAYEVAKKTITPANTAEVSIKAIQ